MLNGIDVSRHQRSIAAEPGERFIYIKATEGSGYTDERCWQHTRQARELGLRIGYYHFARPDTTPRGTGEIDAADEARSFCDTIGTDFDLPPALDWEKYPGLSTQENLEWIKTFLSIVRTRTRRRPVVYTGRNVWRFTTGDADLSAIADLWLVQYSPDPKTPRPIAKGKWSPTLWQWSGGGEFNFSGRGIDCNRFLGDEQAFERFCGRGRKPWWMRCLGF
jgi:GH25 family lysozyme M1 (1,4-beta-N-acetylmuramidase)